MVNFLPAATMSNIDNNIILSIIKTPPSESESVAVISPQKNQRQSDFQSNLQQNYKTSELLLTKNIGNLQQFIQKDVNTKILKNLLQLQSTSNIFNSISETNIPSIAEATPITINEKLEYNNNNNSNNTTLSSLLQLNIHDSSVFLKSQQQLFSNGIKVN